MKRLISIFLALLIAFSTFSFSAFAYDHGEYYLSVKQAIEEYEITFAKKVETNRYYFLMPNGENGQKGDDSSYTYYNQFAPSWYNEYSNTAGVYWWDVNSDYDPPTFPGYSIEKSDSPDVYYVDLPLEVNRVIWSNFVFTSADTSYDGKYPYLRHSTACYTPGYNFGDLSGEDASGDWIYVIDPDLVTVNEVSLKQVCGGEWYYYYGDGCYGTVKDGNTTDCIRDDHDHSQKSAKEALAEYEAETGEKVETNRYYLLMPNGTNGIQCEDKECIKGEHYAESWYNEYTDQPAIYWWKTDVAKPDKFPGYTVEKGDADSVFYADVPKAVTEIVWSNNIEFTYGADDPAKDFGIQTINLPCEYYDAGESDNYPNGTESFDNMIYVIYPDTIGTGELIVGNRPVAGEWYYYYGDGCYGFVKDGKTADCIRDDHDHSDRFLHFDANSTNWRYYEKVYCHIFEYGGDPFYDWQKKAERCTDNDGDGIWTYDLVEHNIELDESKQYAVIFSNELGRQTYNLIFDKTVLGDTAYVGEILGPDHENARTEIAYWRNQDKTEYGPELRINTIGEVQGTCVPKSTTAYDLFKGFLVTYLENAQIYSGKTDQALLDDLAKELKLSEDHVERALKETGVDVEWKHPDKLSVKEAVERYEEKTGEKVDTIRYYFLMPNGSNGQLRTDDNDSNGFAPSWYNTYADKPGVYWWDVAAGLDPPRFPGYYFDESESKDVYYVDIPKEVTTVLWNNYIFESMDLADDPMHAYSRHTDEAILPHQIYSGEINEKTIGWIYVVDPDSERNFDNGKQIYRGKWYFYYGNGCYGETSDGECIRGDHDHRVYDTYIVAGVEKLCGSSWDVYDMNNKMTYNEETGAYEITYTNVPVGNHEFMVTKNHQFGPLTPGNPDYNEAKVTVDGSTVKITYTEGVGVDVIVTPPLLGDVDLDGVISIMDATEIQLASAKKITLTQEQIKLADTDFDGEVSIMDATAIQLYVAKKITEFK